RKMHAHCRDDETEGSAPGISHERSHEPIEAEWQIEQQVPSHNRGGDCCQRERGGSVAEDSHGEEAEQRQAARQSVDAVDDIECVYDRNDKQDRKKQRESAKVDLKEQRLSEASDHDVRR